jgi:hypothetical protein
MKKTLLARRSSPSARHDGLLSGERALDSTLGAVSGLVVAGPIGLIAGGVVGATAGPAIASSWGVRGGHHGRRRHRHHRSY